MTPTMSIYTPVFPQTEPRPLEASQSSSVSDSPATARRPQAVSYTSRLSHWHLSIATLPEELCPASEPSSPASKERSANLQTVIEEAVHEGRYVGDLFKLRSTRIGYATRQPELPCAKGTDIPYILADTEEEWFEWERKVNERRDNLKEKEPERFAPPKSKTLSSRDKVLGWKAGLDREHATEQCRPSEAQQSKLDFPVVKRPSKLKPAKTTIPVSNAPAVKAKETTPTTFSQPPISNIDIQSDKSNDALPDRIISCIATRDPPSVSEPTPPSPSPLGNKEPIDSQAAEDVHHDQVLQLLNESVCRPGSFQCNVYEIVLIFYSQDCPPPSFPSQLATSTPKKNVAPTTELAQQILLDMRPLTDLPSPSEAAEKPIPLFQPLPINATPPSPPPSSQVSPMLTSARAQRATSVIPVSAQPQFNSAQRKDVRPLTPEREENAPFTAITQNTPRTPEKQPLKRYRTMPAFRNTNGVPSTPLSSINGVGLVRGSTEVPTTPEQQVVVDLLATSRKSIPRPRPPSRKGRREGGEQDIGITADEAADPTPARSERSYFSSPASGDSSGSIRTTHLPSSPSSPLNFTQNPGKFVPMGQSTQHLSPSDLELAAQRAHLTSSQNGGLGTGLHRASSGLVGMVYNSQFDLESRVNEVSDFLGKDVDFGAWIREEEEEEDVGRVEEMTLA